MNLIKFAVATSQNDGAKHADAGRKSRKIANFQAEETLAATGCGVGENQILLMKGIRASLTVCVM